ncbi:protein of unknown function [Streptomyces murinus]
MATRQSLLADIDMHRLAPNKGHFDHPPVLRRVTLVTLCCHTTSHELRKESPWITPRRNRQRALGAA